ncbi:MAG TPA: LAGLIDADG family homing endonuclease [Thermoplasmata archaeon]|nr:LAGLIDADG family homing endonuclease [Thermoplasmata archaeon]
MVAVRRTLPAPPEVTGRWVAVFEEAGLRPKILEVMDRYPELRSIEIPFPQIERTDTALADLLLERPEEVVEAGRRAMRELLPVAGPESEGLRLRVTQLPVLAHRPIREIRESDLNHLIAIDGIVRKATDVRPQIREAVFSCNVCRAEIHELQDDGSLVIREPIECSSCGRPVGRTRFRLLAEKSVYIDGQRIEIQENPESLKGGAHPQGVTVLLTEDLTGRVIPGNRIVANGVLRSQQRATVTRSGAVKSASFDLMLLGNSIEAKQVEFEEIAISEEDEKLITSFRGDPTVLDKIVLSLAPTIRGMEIEKRAIALQLFGGVEKRHPDGIRVRGDIHILLLGDPGCLIGDERVVLGNGTTIRLNRMGRRHLEPIQHSVLLGTGLGRSGAATVFHRYTRQRVLEVVTESGKCIKGTYNHPLSRRRPGTRTDEWCRLDSLRPDDRIRVVPSAKCSKRSPVATGWTVPRYYHDGWHVKVPRVVDEDLAAIFGYVLGDGTVGPRHLALFPSVEEREVAAGISELFVKVFGVQPKPQKVRHNCRPLEVHRTPIARWLRGLRRHRVPDSIFASPNRVVASFLRWLFEADGSCFGLGRGRTSIQLRSSEIELLRDVQALLLRWGIHGRILWGSAPTPHRKDGRWVRGGPSGNLVIRQGPSMIRFAREIGFVSRRKRAKLAGVVRVAERRARARHRALYERIVSIRPAGVATVYDIEVTDAHRFIANGIVSHNTAKSQLLRYVAAVAPRGIYASGKGTTAAGLTAAAVKDDFAGGRWMLEAGLLVLADGGIAAIDELDKMTPEDRSAMHEALEQQTVSVSKAGITATLNARCPVLAAANPKWGRFTSEEFANQVDLPPTLLSRFDVIFPIVDRPEQSHDRSLARQILKSHQEGERLAAGGLEGTQEAPLRPEFLRKYIAYARRNLRPVLSEEARSAIEDYYVRVRSEGERGSGRDREGTDQAPPVPITARQLEALIRLSEASARARLSPVVTALDAERAIGIVQAFLDRMTTAGGTAHDIDRVTTGMPREKQGQIETIMNLMRELQEEKGGRFTEEELIERAAKIPYTREKVAYLLGYLKNVGEVMEVRPSVFQLVRFF